MSNSKSMIIHIIAEVVLFTATSMYFGSKISKLTSSVCQLEQIVNAHEKKFEEYDIKIERLKSLISILQMGGFASNNNDILYGESKSSNEHVVESKSRPNDTCKITKCVSFSPTEINMSVNESVIYEESIGEETMDDELMSELNELNSEIVSKNENTIHIEVDESQNEQSTHQ